MDNNLQKALANCIYDEVSHFVRIMEDKGFRYENINMLLSDRFDKLIANMQTLKEDIIQEILKKI